MMSRVFLLTMLCVCSSRSLLAGELLSERQAIARIRALPEFKTYAAHHEAAFDDNERIELPATAEAAWRIDVHTVVRDPLGHAPVPVEPLRGFGRLWRHLRLGTSR